MLQERQHRLSVARRLACLEPSAIKELAQRFADLASPPEQTRRWALCWLHQAPLESATLLQVDVGDHDCDLLVFAEDVAPRKVQLAKWDEYRALDLALLQDLFCEPAATLLGRYGWSGETARGFDDCDQYGWRLPCRELREERDKCTLQLPSAFKLKAVALRNSWLRLRGRCRLLCSNASLRLVQMGDFRSLRLWLPQQECALTLDATTFASRALDTTQLAAPDAWCLVECDADLMLSYGATAGVLFLWAEDGQCEMDARAGWLELWSAAPFAPPLRYVVEETPLQWSMRSDNGPFLRRFAVRQQLQTMRVTWHNDEQLQFSQPDQTPFYVVAQTHDAQALHYVLYDQFSRPMAQLRFVRTTYELYFTLLD